MAMPRLNARVFAVSDLHTDVASGKNMSWVTSLSPTDFQSDCLIVAGDVAADLQTTEATLRSLRAKFAQVVFVAGNHDLWVQHPGQKKTDPRRAADESGERGSMARLRALDSLCKRLGVDTGPVEVAGRCLICPLLAWYGRTTDPAALPAGYKTDTLQAWMDFWNCDWDSVARSAGKGTDAMLEQAAEVNRALLDLNADRLAVLAMLQSARPSLPVITFSHFVPRADLLPDYERLKFKELIDVSVSDGLELLIREAGAVVHVFGHTHIPVKKVRDGVTYIQQPLGYPGEPWIKPDQKHMAKMVVWPQQTMKFYP